MAANILEMKNVTKVYPNGVIANKDINFSLVKGEIHALAGENGAGKSTLMKIIFGMEQPSEGEIFLNGQKNKLVSPLDAIAKGIGMVHQHFMLVPSFTVAENIILGTEPKKRLSIDYKEAVKQVNEISKKYNLMVDPNMITDDLTVGMKQKVEILKALFRGAKILILDEPTAVLTPQETDELFLQLKKLKDNGLTIVFISHKLKEVKQICDRITIMRAGKDMGVYHTKDVTEKEISKLMVGRDIVLKYNKDEVNATKSVLKIDKLTIKDETGKKVLNDLSLSLCDGQILGVAGVDGNGQSQLVSAIVGENNSYEGGIYVAGTNTNGMSIRQIRKLGLSYIPEDRMRQGIAGDASITDNMISNRYSGKEIGNGIVLNQNKITELGKKLINDYGVKCADEKQKINMLSGGNMQKVVVARECSVNPNLLIAEQPTRGVDVGSAQFIHENILRLRKNQTGILLVSADLNEVVELSDHLIVMYEGEIVAYFKDPQSVSEEELGLSMLGLKKQPKEEILKCFEEVPHV